MNETMTGAGPRHETTPGGDGRRYDRKRDRPSLLINRRTRQEGTGDNERPTVSVYRTDVRQTGKAGTVPHIQHEPASACLLADTIERTTTSNAQPYITTHGPSERDEARRPNETPRRDESKDDTNPLACLPAASRLMTPIPFVPVGRDTRR